MYANSKQINTKRITAVLICAVLLFTALFSGIFIIHAANHVCSHDNCSVCSAIQQCRNTLELMGIGKIVYCVAILMQIFALAVLPRLMDSDSGDTLLARKVRLNN